MDKVATDIRETLSKTEQGDAVKQTPLAPLQTLKPEHKEETNPHSNILDSLLKAISPKPATPAEPAKQELPIVDNPAPGVSQKKAAMDTADLKDGIKKSFESVSEDGFSSLREMFESAKANGVDTSKLASDIEAFVKEMTGNFSVPSTSDLKQVEKEEAIEAIDEEAQKGKAAEGFHAQENKNMEGLFNISARIASLGATAGENPFAKKDEDKKEDKPEGDKKANPFEKKDDKSEDKKEEKSEKKDEKSEEKSEKKEDKKDEKSEPKEEKSEEPKKSKSEEKREKKEEKDDLKALKEALKIMEKFLSKEEKEGETGEVAKAREVVETIKELAGEEVKEAAGDAVALPPMDMKMEGPESPIEKAGEEPKDMFGDKDLAKEPMDTMKPGAPMEGGMKPIPTIKPTLALAKFVVGDRVLSRSAEVSDEDPGKVIAVCANNKYVIDWGTEVPTEEDGKMLIKVDAAAEPKGLFTNAPAQEIEAAQPEGGQMAAYDNEETRVLSNMSFADALTRMNEDYDDNCDVMHIGSGLKGKIVSKAANRLVVDFGGKETELFSHEVKLFSSDL